MRFIRPLIVPLTVLCFVVSTSFGQTSSTAANPSAKSGAPAPAEHPLTKLPYTPSLDVPSMDKSVDPCVDFYTYSCGGWEKKNPIPGDQAAWDVYGKLANENRMFLWGILEEAAKPSPNRSAVDQKIGDFFSSCMDEPAVNKLGAAPLKGDLATINNMKSTADLAPVLAKLHLNTAGSGMAFGFGSSQDFADSSKVIAFLLAGGLGLPDRDYYTKDDAKFKENREKYLVYVQQMFELLGDAAEKAKAESETVMRMETALAKASLTRVERRNPHNLDHKMTPEQLAALTPSFHWNDYFSGEGLPSQKELNVTEPNFYKELENQLKTASLDDWKTYLRFHLASSRAPYLSKDFVQANFDFYSKYLRGVKEMPARWKKCEGLVDRDLGEALGQAFVKKTFGPEVKKAAVDMTLQIEKAMEEEIKNLTWMSPETKTQALEKLHGIANKVGYPDKWRDYSTLNVVRGDFYGNVNRATVFESKRDINKIGKPVDHGEWGMTPPTVNAYYDAQMNDINFPAGVLQPPLYDFKMDDAPNYGNTGATIGHELTHGFDDEGRQFDAKGNLRDWWTKEDAEKFDKLAACTSDEYSQFTIVDDIKINGNLTMGEDIADLGGTQLAYIAWKNATQGKQLHDIDGFTPDQRFFIGMAQWACGNQTPENLRLGAVTNPHSPEKYRINGVVSNMPEFFKAFSCKAGQPMVRENVCRIW